MKVKELVKYLNKYDENTEVIIKSEEEDTVLIPVFNRDTNKLMLVSGSAKEDVSEIIKQLFILLDEVFVGDCEYNFINKLIQCGITSNNIEKYLDKDHIDRIEKICKKYKLEF